MDPSSQNRAGAGASGRRLVIAGAGDVGGRLALRRVLLGDDVIAVRRRDVAMSPGVRGVRADLASGEGLSRLPRRVEALVFCAAPDRRDEAAYRALYVDGLRRLLDACDAPRVLFVSSTAVYREDAGEWVDEATPPLPQAFNGQALLAAEQVLSAHAGGIALRLSGLYGPGREMMLRKSRAGEPGRPHWTNRIHVEDAASALSCLLDIAAPESLYLAATTCRRVKTRSWPGCVTRRAAGRGRRHGRRERAPHPQYPPARHRLVAGTRRLSQRLCGDAGGAGRIVGRAPSGLRTGEGHGYCHQGDRSFFVLQERHRGRRAGGTQEGRQEREEHPGAWVNDIKVVTDGAGAVTEWRVNMRVSFIVS